MSSRFFSVVFSVLCFLVAPILTGCVAIHDRKTQDVPCVPPLSSQMERRNAVYTFSAETDFFTRQEAHPFVRTITHDEMEKVLKGGGYFETLNGVTNADLTINAKLVTSRTPAAMLPAFITAFSLFLIPSWATETYETSVTMQWNNQTHEYCLKDSMTTIVWLPMILASPFGPPGIVGPDVRENLWRNTLLQMYNDGVFNKKQPVAGNIPKTDIQPNLLSRKMPPTEMSALILQKLDTLKNLRNGGVLTQTEYDAKRAVLLEQL